MASKFTDAVRDTLIGFFNSGDQPTEAQFTQLITAIQEGLELHDHDGSGDGDGIGTLLGIAVKTLVTTPGGELTIDAAGAITVTYSYHSVDTFGDAATDDLITINGGVNGQILILRSADSARDTTLKQGGNLWLAGDFTLTSVADRITLQHQGGSWYEISRSDNN